MTTGKYDSFFKRVAAEGGLELDGIRTDAQDTINFGRALETVEATLYEFKYPEFKARSLFNISYPGQPTDDFITWNLMNAQADAVKPITNYAGDFPGVSVSGEQNTNRVFSFGNSYQYSLLDLRQAARTGKPLDTMLAYAAKRAHEKNLEDIACSGSANPSTGKVIQTGFCNDPNLPTLTASTAVATGGTPTVTGWNATSKKTPEEIRADLARLITAPRVNSMGVYQRATNVLMPLAQYTYLDTTMYTTNGFSTQTLLGWVKGQFPDVSFDYWIPLATAGAGGNPCAIAYVKKAEVVDLALTQEFEAMAPQMHNMAFLVPCWMRIAGIRLRQPFAACRMDGI